MICDGPELHTVLSFDAPDRYEQAVGIGPEAYFRRWVRCARCGFHQSQYSRPEEALDRLYGQAYRDTQASWRGGSTEAVFERVIALPDDQSESVVRRDWILEGIARLTEVGSVAWSPGPRRLLDVGGATGTFAHAFSRAGWECSVVDPAESGRFLSKHGITYRQAPYAPGLFPDPFHLVSLVFTLEHVRDPLAMLRDCARDAAPGGLVYVEVPDALAFVHRSPEDDIFNACHLWMFDPATLTTLMSRAGLAAAKLQRVRTLRGHLALMALGQPS